MLWCAAAGLDAVHLGRESVEVLFPSCGSMQLPQVPFELGQRLESQLVSALASDRFVENEAGFSQHAQVTAHRGAADGEATRNGAGSCGTTAQQQQNPPANGVSQSLGNGVHGEYVTTLLLIGKGSNHRDLRSETEGRHGRFCKAGCAAAAPDSDP